MDKEKYFNVMKNYKRMASNLVAEISSYEGWSDDFCRNQAKELYAKLIKEFDNCDFTQFTAEELKTFDFRWWDENLILMPVWVLDCLPDGTELHSIGEEMGDTYFIKFDKSKGLDKDTRMGVTAYGFNKAQLRDATINNILNNDQL